MKQLFIFSILCLSHAGFLRAQLITSIPGPDDQGGMIMPMFSIVGADNNSNPTRGTISVNFSPTSVPQMQSLQQWSPGSYFATNAAWRTDLGSPNGVGGTPLANAGNGDLFNNQYGFTFMGNPMMGTAYVPSGKSLGIKMLSLSSPLLEVYNYVNAQNRWDQILAATNSQVLWNGSMWHGYFTLPESAAAGTYSATFEVFIANQTFTTGTGFADYTAAARNATRDTNFTTATVSYTWSVVPEPRTGFLLALAALLIGAARLKSRRRQP
ncbi:MAG: PEP-CTERM sorting domain-containing protein [Chthoniobacterales bacterium]